MRVNARLDDSYEDKFISIEKKEHKSRTEILKEALDDYFLRKLQTEENIAWEKNQQLLKQLAGIGSGPEDGSSDYKRYVKEYLDDKFTDR